MSTRMRRVIGTGLGVLLISVITVFGVSAQVGSQGQISGFVHDGNGAPVSGATVVVTNTGTKQQRAAQTNGEGYYVVTNIPPAIYDVSVEQTGFRKFLQTGVKLDAAGKEAVDIVLQIGNVTETVTIQASGSQLQESTATVGRTIEGSQVSELGLNGRNPVRLAALKAGVIGSGPSSFTFTPTDGGFNVNGSRGDQNSILLDGVQQERTRAAGSTTGVVDVDTLQEVQILTSNYAPEFGRAVGSQMLMVTKSGTSEFHGSVYEFFRNNAMDANTWSNNSIPLTNINKTAAGPPELRFNQPGYTIGGPIYIPRHFNTEKNKLFFFFAQEWVRDIEGSNASATVPSVALRNGDISEFGPGKDGTWGTKDDPIIDPRTIASGNPVGFSSPIIPSSLISPTGKAILNAFPLPNCIGCFVGQTTNFIASGTNRTNTSNTTLRLDYYLGKNHLSFRGSKFEWSVLGAFRGSFAFTPDDQNRPNRSAGLTFTSELKPTLINEFTMGVSKDIVLLGVGGTPSRSAVGINYPYIFPGTKELEDKVPTIAIQNYGTIDGGPYPSSSKGLILTWADNMTWVRSAHTFKFGVNIERSGEDDFDQINISQVPGDTNNQNGRFEFNNNRPFGTGVGVTDALLGLFSNYGEIGQKAYTPWRATTFETYWQDSWKARRNLTVEYGVRYNLWPPWHSLWNNIATFDPAFYTPGLLSINPKDGSVVVKPGADFTLARFDGITLPGNGFPTSANGRVAVLNNPAINSSELFRGIPDGISETHHNMFEPRLGIAYALNEKTTIRAGFAVFHSRVLLNDSTLLGGNAPLQFKVGVQNGSADNPGGVINTFADSIKFPFTLTAQDKVFKLPTVYNWSMTVQRELPDKFILEVGYVGKRSLYLQRERNINSLQPGQAYLYDASGNVTGPVPSINALRPYLGMGQIRLSENSGNAIYHSLQAQLSRRFQNGFSFDMAYTYSKSLDDTSDKRDVLPQNFDDSNIRGLSSFDRTHVFTANYIYELPIGKNKRFLNNISRLGDYLIGGWQMQGISTISSGGVFSIGIPIDALGVGDGGNNIVQTAELTCSVTTVGASIGKNYFSNPNCFTLPAIGTQGNSGRNTFRGPIFQDHDLSIFKNFQIREKLKAQFRVEMYNFLNHPNMGGPNTNINDNNRIGTKPQLPTYGQIIGQGGFGVVSSKTGDRRIMQLGLKLYF